MAAGAASLSVGAKRGEGRDGDGLRRTRLSGVGRDAAIWHCELPVLVVVVVVGRSRSWSLVWARAGAGAGAGLRVARIGGSSLAGEAAAVGPAAAESVAVLAGPVAVAVEALCGASLAGGGSLVRYTFTAGRGGRWVGLLEGAWNGHGG